MTRKLAAAMIRQYATSMKDDEEFLEETGWILARMNEDDPKEKK